MYIFSGGAPLPTRVPGNYPGMTKTIARVPGNYPGMTKKIRFGTWLPQSILG